MEILKLREKAEVYSKKFVPTVKHKFVDVCVVDTQQNHSCHEKIIIKPPKQKVLPAFIICLMVLVMSFFGCKLLIKHNETFGSELLVVIERLFVPKDFGKIKFVDVNNGQLETEAYSNIIGLEIPFFSCVSTLVGETFLLESPSEVIVKCAMDGVVVSVKTDPVNFKKSVVVEHKHDIKTEYYLLDNLSVKVGDSVKKNTPLGITMNSQIGFKISYKNTIVKGLEIKDGELVFL